MVGDPISSASPNASNVSLSWADTGSSALVKTSNNEKKVIQLLKPLGSATKLGHGRLFVLRATIVVSN